MVRQMIALALLAFGFTQVVRADEAADLLARWKAASGGAHWDAVKSVRTDGTLSAGGLSGAFDALQDVERGRSNDHYKLGPIEGADGYDGTVAWTRDPGGEVAVLDAPEAKRRARSQAWLDARGYWYPSRIGASYGKPEVRELDGRRYDVLVATPDGGDPVTLWFDARTHLLVRTEQKQGADTATTSFDDWRDVDGVKLPFHSATFLTDTAGRVDERNRSEVQASSMKVNVTVSRVDPITWAISRCVRGAEIKIPRGVGTPHRSAALSRNSASLPSTLRKSMDSMRSSISRCRRSKIESTPPPKAGSTATRSRASAMGTRRISASSIHSSCRWAATSLAGMNLGLAAAASSSEEASASESASDASSASSSRPAALLLLPLPLPLPLPSAATASSASPAPSSSSSSPSRSAS